jgi:hypothetical protein
VNDRYPVPVVIAAIITFGIITVSLVLGLVYLAGTGHSTEAITSFFGAGNIGALLYLAARLRSIEQQTNGTQSKLLDAALKSPPVDVTTTP